MLVWRQRNSLKGLKVDGALQWVYFNLRVFSFEKSFTDLTYSFVIQRSVHYILTQLWPFACFIC